MKCLFTLFALTTAPGVLCAQSSSVENPGDSRCEGGSPLMKKSYASCDTGRGGPCKLAPAQALNVPWSGYGHDPQHTAVSATASQNLNAKHWHVPIDQSLPNGGSGPLFVHYGSPLVTAGNTVLVPITTASGGYQLEAFNGADGSQIYTLPSDYTPPPHDWTPPYGPALALGTRIYYAGAGGTLYYRDLPNSAQGPNNLPGASGQVAFYGMTGTKGYTANQTAYNSAVQISTPLTMIEPTILPPQ